jgi:hypothetical protein
VRPAAPVPNHYNRKSETETVFWTYIHRDTGRCPDDDTDVVDVDDTGTRSLLLVAGGLPAAARTLELPSLGAHEGLDVAAGHAGSAKVPVRLAGLARP